MLLLLTGVLLLPLAVGGLITVGPAALACGFPALLLTIAGVRELNRWTGGAAPATEVQASRHVNVLLAIYVVLSVVPIAVAVSHASFWDSAGAPVASLISLALVVALVRGSRAAWLLLLLFDLALIASLVWAPAELMFVAIVVVRVALLLSPPLRRFVGDAPDATPVQPPARA